MEPAKTAPQACILIDGDKIRRIRQDRGFTQLYVATCLAVTTDTVSRWENKHSPSIKQENAEKLAEVLEVALAEITLDDDDKARENPAADTVEPAEERVEETTPIRSSKRRFWLISLALLVPAVLLFGNLFTHKNEEITPPAVTAERFLPAHTSPHLPFPVFIRVHRLQDSPVPFILRESFPDSVTVKNAVPPFTALNAQEGKWIDTAGEQDRIFGYLAQASSDVSPGEQLVFKGHLFVEDQSLSIGGATTIRMENFHWADRNADYIIDDNEILAIYSFFKLFQQMGIDIDEIQRIWAGNGYRWDEAGGRFVVVSKKTS